MRTCAELNFDTPTDFYSWAVACNHTPITFWTRMYRAPLAVSGMSRAERYENVDRCPLAECSDACVCQHPIFCAGRAG